jgi:ShK domain-like
MLTMLLMFLVVGALGACIDTDDQCQTWAKDGYCFTQETVRQTCQTSCNLCPQTTTTPTTTITTSSPCLNTDPVCSTINTNQCFVNDTLRTLCPITCNLCQSCLDKFTYCPAWGQRNFCDMEYVQRACRQTCGTCSVSYQNDPNCDYWKQVGECLKSQEFMSVVCIGTCP